MSEVTMLQSSVRYGSQETQGQRQASPDSTRQAAKEGGKVLPPTVSSSAVEQNRSEQGEQPDMQQAVTQMNEYIQSTQRDLRFSIDEELGETIVKVVDRQTDEVIRQIPDEVFLKLARSLQERTEPLSFLNEQA